MPLPDPHEHEMTVELDQEDQDKYKFLLRAKDAIIGWTKIYNRLKAELMATLGDATAATVDGEKVVYYRPKDQYAISRLEADYPDLTQRFKKMKVQEVLDVDAFGQAHPDILAKYRVRAFVERAL